MIVYFNDQFLRREEVCVSPDDRGFLLADGAYEVLRSYKGRLFKVTEHLSRLDHSLRELRFQMPHLSRFGALAEMLLRQNDLHLDDAVLYIQVTRGVAPRAHAFPSPQTTPTVYLAVSSFQPSLEKWEHGVSIILVPDIRWVRCDIKSVALLPNVLASQEAKERGAEEAVFVREGLLTEGAHTNICGVFGGHLVTHPATHHILAGITRQVVLDLCAELEIPVLESPIDRQALPEAEELMILGTTTEIMPVVQVDNQQVGPGRPGPLTRKLQQAFRKLVAG